MPPHSHHSTHHSSLSWAQENIIVKFWEENVKGILFGVLYTMTKENTLPVVFVICSMAFEFLQVIMFVFRPDYYWGGLAVNANINISIIGYGLFQALFWCVFGLLVITTINATYVGYSFHLGLGTSIHFLRLLRWICSLTVSVLFIPILSVLIGGLACDYSLTPPMLMLFPRVACWGSTHLPIGLIAIVLIVVFSVFSLFTGLTYYEFDPFIINASGRLQNRFEFVALCIKMLLVVVNYFLAAHPVIFLIVLLFSGTVLFSCWLIMLPAYDRRINLVRAASFLGIVWVGISSVVSYQIHDGHNYTSLIILILGLPPSFALGAYVAHRRFKYLCDPSLVALSIEAAVPQMKKNNRVIQWQDTSNVIIRNKLFYRLVFPTDVEIAARFVLASKRPAQSVIDQAKLVYQTGLRKFPKSASVMQAYVNFIFSVLGDMQLGYATLEQLRKMRPAVDIQFFIYRYDKDREQRSDGSTIGDFVSYLEYKKMHQAARRFHIQAAVNVRRFWKYLLSPVVDVLALSEMSSTIAHAQRKATHEYEKLLKAHPNNVRALRDYARFFDEIANDETTAKRLRKQADACETKEMERLTESHTGSPTGDFKPDILEQELNKTNSDAESNHSTDIESITTSSSVADGLASARIERKNKLKTLGWILFFTTILAMVVVFIQLGVVTTQLDTYKSVILTVEATGSISQALITMSTSIVDAYALGLNSLFGGATAYAWTGTFSQAMLAARENTYIFQNNLRALYLGTSQLDSFTTPGVRELKLNSGAYLKFDPSLGPIPLNQFDGKIANKAKIQKFFLENNFNASYSVSETEDVFQEIDLWSFSNILVASMTNIVFTNETFLVSGDKSIVYDVALLLQNALPLAQEYLKLLDLCTSFVQQKLKTASATLDIIFGISQLFLLLGVILIFRPVVNKIFNNRVRTLHMFTVIPTHIVEHMAKKKMASLGALESDEEEEGDLSGEESEYEEVVEEVPPDQVVEQSKPEVAYTPRLQPPRLPPLVPPEVPRTPRDGEPVRTPRTPGGTLIPRTPGGSIIRTPRQDTDNQKKTLLLPNIIEENEEELEAEKEDQGTFKDLRNSVEERAAKKLADSLFGTGARAIELDTKDAKPSSDSLYSQPSEQEPIAGSSSAGASGVGVRRMSSDIRTKRQKRRFSRDIQPRARRASQVSQMDGNLSDNELESKVISFKDKLSLSLLPVVQMNREDKQEAEPMLAPPAPPTPPPLDKATSATGKLSKLTRKKSRKAEINIKNGGDRMIVSSLRRVVTKVHLSYGLGILLISAAIAIAYGFSLRAVNRLHDVDTHLKLIELRSQYANMLVYDVSLMSFFADTVPLSAARMYTVTVRQVSAVDTLIEAQGYEMDYLYVAGTCLRINQSQCTETMATSYPYYDFVAYGFDTLFSKFNQIGASVALSVIKSGGKPISPENKAYVTYRNLANNDVLDGLDTLRFLAYEDAKIQVSDAKRRIAVICTCTSIAFVLIHLLVFRPFVRRLGLESEHTSAILLMIPRRLLLEVPQIQTFLRDQADVSNV